MQECAVSEAVSGKDVSPQPLSADGLAVLAFYIPCPLPAASDRELTYLAPEPDPADG